jgi:hypothetical protein
MGASYLGGLVFYVFRIPERFRPGKFDIIVIMLIILLIRAKVIRFGTALFFWEYYSLILVLLITFKIDVKLHVY